MNCGQKEHGNRDMSIRSKRSIKERGQRAMALEKKGRLRLRHKESLDKFLSYEEFLRFQMYSKCLRNSKKAKGQCLTVV